MCSLRSQTPGKTCSSLRVIALILRSSAITCLDNGTMCGLGFFIRSAGISHRARSKSVSIQGVRVPYSYTGVWRELERATEAAKIGHLGTHSFRHTHRSWLDAVGTSIAVQQKMMRHSDIRTTMNIYGDVVTDEMSTAGAKVSELAFKGNRAQTERNGR